MKYIVKINTILLEISTTRKLISSTGSFLLLVLYALSNKQVLKLIPFQALLIIIIVSIISLIVKKPHQNKTAFFLSLSILVAASILQFVFGVNLVVAALINFCIVSIGLMTRKYGVTSPATDKSRVANSG